MPVPASSSHPKAMLLWDVGVIPDAVVGPKGAAPPSIHCRVVTRTLKASSRDDTAGRHHLRAISHAHRPHRNSRVHGIDLADTARRRDFAWTPDNPSTRRSSAPGRRARVRHRDRRHDVFGDGRAIIKAAATRPGTRCWRSTSRQRARGDRRGFVSLPTQRARRAALRRQPSTARSRPPRASGSRPICCRPKRPCGSNTTSLPTPS
jgi:hypothetical protein